MVELGAAHGVPTRAADGDELPAGSNRRQCIEVAGALEVLAGGGPPGSELRLTLQLAGEMLELAGIGQDPAEQLQDGTAMDPARRLVARR